MTDSCDAHRGSNDQTWRKSFERPANWQRSDREREDGDERSAEHRSRPRRLGGRLLLERVIERLQADGFRVTAPQFPLTSLADDVARLRQVLDFQDRATVVVGHSYGGQIITALGEDAPNVVGLVYIAAFGLDQGESLGQLLSQGPVTPALAHLFTDSRGFGWLSEDDFVNH